MLQWCIFHSLPGYGYCAEMMCTKYKYDENGEIDGSADMETTCASYEEGCPCNEEWEVSCESWGYKAEPPIDISPMCSMC